MITEFWDEENGGFYFTSKDHEELIVRNKDFYDNATPSGNSVAADVLLKDRETRRENTIDLRFPFSVWRRANAAISAGIWTGTFGARIHFAEDQRDRVVGPPGNELERAILSRYLPSCRESAVERTRSRCGDDPAPQREKYDR